MERQVTFSCSLKPIARLQELSQRLFLGRPRFRPPVVLPARQRRQRHQDRLGATAGLETEAGAAVVEQVELDVATATVELEAALALGPGCRAPPLGDRQVSGQNVIADAALEGEARS